MTDHTALQEARDSLPDPRRALGEPAQRLVHAAFADWVGQTPQRPAVRQSGQVWTYAELEKQSRALARLLLRKDLRRGDVVGVLGPPCFGTIAALMAVLRSGAVLLPIDQKLPFLRQAVMMREAKARAILCAGGPWTGEGIAAFSVDPESGSSLEADDGAGLIPLPETAPDDPAYVFFTSGSTGIPKGVLGCHKGLAHFVNWQRETFAVGPDDRVAQLTSLSFDPVLRDVFLPLTSGATLCLPEESDRLG
ncbi:MAG: AMP-binding protein, partial [Bryobacteraceae bacterium]